MATTKTITPANVVERNIHLVKEIMRYLMDNPLVFEALPTKFEVVILPENDPEMRLYNLDLLDRYGSEGKPIVFARVKVEGERIAIQDKPSLYAPIPIAA